MDYQSNSFRDKQKIVRDTDEAKKVERLISGDIKRRKTSTTKRVINEFVKGDLNTLKEYAIWDVWIPAIKNSLYGSLIGTIDAIFGKAAGPSNRGHRDYRDYFSTPLYRATEDRDRDRLKGRNVYGYDEIIYSSKSESERIVVGLNGLINEFGSASVADYYQMSGAEHEYTDNKYGWDEPIPNRITRLRDGGYSIVLPKPIVLD